MDPTLWRMLSSRSPSLPSSTLPRMLLDYLLSYLVTKPMRKTLSTCEDPNLNPRTRSHMFSPISKLASFRLVSTLIDFILFPGSSNILIGFLSYLGRHLVILAGRPAKQFSHAALALILERGQSVTRQVLVTSSPLHPQLGRFTSLRNNLDSIHM
jgi:hypothetical protein